MHRCAVGNRLAALNVSPYNYNNANELTSDSSGSFTYDSNGNTLTDASGRSFTWDYENRLSTAVLSGSTVSFQYDPFGRRVQKNSATGTINYIYDGANILEELGSTGTVLARYTQGLGIDAPLAENRSGITSFYEQDALGSVTSLTNGAGAITDTYTFDSFGNTTSSGSTLNPSRYTGREFDSETGLYYYRARYYDPGIGRFISEDPIRFLGGADFYRYVSDNPISLNDPFGLCGCDSKPPVYPNAFERNFKWLRNGGFIYYGNWGGPGYSGGQLTPIEDLSQEDQQNLAPPIDSQDACYMQHDYCYSNARVNDGTRSCDNPTAKQKNAFANDTGNCDYELYLCLRDVNAGSGPGHNASSVIAEPVFSLKELLSW